MPSTSVIVVALPFPHGRNGSTVNGRYIIMIDRRRRDRGRNNQLINCNDEEGVSSFAIFAPHDVYVLLWMAR